MFFFLEKELKSSGKLIETILTKSNLYTSVCTRFHMNLVQDKPCFIYIYITWFLIRLSVSQASCYPAVARLVTSLGFLYCHLLIKKPNKNTTNKCYLLFNKSD